MKLLIKIFTLFFISFLFTNLIFGQTSKYSFKGFIKSDIFWDSRQVASARQGHFLLYPLNEKLDSAGIDIHNSSCFHILPIQSRMIFSGNGKEILGAKSFAKIEGEFFGNSEIGINSFRLRHAFFKLNWKHSQLLVGQFWHPMFIETNYPSTISFNTGVPFIPFSRNPQIRFTYELKDIELMATTFSQLDFKSSGPNGPNVSYAVRGGLPALNLRVIYHPNFDNAIKLNMGISLNRKSLKPTLITASGYKNENVFASYAATAFLGIKNTRFGAKIQGTYGEDMYNLTMIGGYGILSNTDSKSNSYSANQTAAIWLDVHNQNPIHHFGVLMGFTQNMGSKDASIESYYGRGSDIDYVYRISPRYAYKIGHFKIASEIEYTVAAYGMPDQYGTIEHSTEHNNVRLLVAMYYMFDIKIKQN